MDERDILSTFFLISEANPHLTVNCCSRTYSDAIERPLINKKAKFSMNDHPRICSTESRYSTYILLHNNAGGRVDVIWINYMGKPMRYFTMEPGTTRKLNTFKTHPWIFRNRETGERMMVDGKDIYWPPSCQYKVDGNQVTAIRQDVRIRAPVRSLRTVAMNRCADLVGTVDNLGDIDLPKALVVEIKALIKFGETYRDLRDV